MSTTKKIVREGLQEGGEISMSNNGIVTIHGKEYMTVARRVELAHQDKTLESVETQVISHDPIVVHAKVTVKGKVYTGISSVNPDTARLIEKENPYEVAETSAVGRALGFAGYGLIESIASADEMVRATSQKKLDIATDGTGDKTRLVKIACDICGKPATERKGTTKTGKQYHGIFCTSEEKSHTRWLWN